jgi:hypothetical protein
MAVQFVSPPPAVLSSYQQSLVDFLGPHDPEILLYHLPVGTLGLAELANGATLADIVPTGWRMFASWPDGTWTSCEMTNPTLYAQAEFRNFVQGDFAALAFARIIAAQALEALQSVDYQLQFLSVPGIYLEALHLVCQGQGIDLILPVLSFDPQLGTGAVFNASDFLATARAIATARVALTSSSPLSS